MPVDPESPARLRRDPGALLARQIAALAGNRAEVRLKRERSWASITFSGTRRCFAIEWTDVAEPGEVETLARALPDHEFSIPGHFVADILVTDQSATRLLIELLSIIDPLELIRDE